MDHSNVYISKRVDIDGFDAYTKLAFIKSGEVTNNTDRITFVEYSKFGLIEGNEVTMDYYDFTLKYRPITDKEMEYMKEAQNNRIY